MSDDDFDRMFGSVPTPRPTQGGFADRLMGEAQSKGYLRSPTNQTPDEPNEAAVGDGPYKPYGYMPAANLGETCDVRRWIDGTEAAEGIEFQYRFLMQIGYVGDEQIKLFLPDCIVVIEGHKLRDLRKKLARRQVTFIQQFSALVWPRPDAGEPIIDAIAVMRPEAVRGAGG